MIGVIFTSQSDGFHLLHCFNSRSELQITSSFEKSLLNEVGIVLSSSYERVKDTLEVSWSADFIRF